MWQTSNGLLDWPSVLGGCQYQGLYACPQRPRQSALWSITFLALLFNMEIGMHLCAHNQYEGFVCLGGSHWDDV